MMTKKRADNLQEVISWLGYISENEANLLQELTRSLPFNPIVINIGAGAGTSALAFMQSRDDIRLTTIDVNLESPFGCLNGELQVLRDCGINLNMENYNQICDDSKKVGTRWNMVDVDLVFVDGDHSREGARGDISIWIKNIKKDGIMVIHDYKKIESYMKINNLTEVSKEEIKSIKPWGHVDLAVDELLIPNFEMISHIETTIAFRIN